METMAGKWLGFGMLLGGTFFVACAMLDRGGLAPLNQTQKVPGDDSVAAVSSKQLEIRVDGDAWEGNPDDLKKVLTPMQVTVSNLGKEPLRIQHRDFALEGVSGVRYEAQPPFQIQKEAPARTAVVPAYGWSGFHLADYLSPTYGAGFRVWPDPIAHDPEFYRVQWRPDLPTIDMLAKSLPEGVLDPGGTVSGFVYFPVVPKDEKRVVFSADLEPVRGGRQMAAVEIPFQVK